MAHAISIMLVSIIFCMLQTLLHYSGNISRHFLLSRHIIIVKLEITFVVAVQCKKLLKRKISLCFRL